MNIIEFIVLLIVAGGLGLLSQRITGFHIGGFIASILLGFGGAFLGKELALRFGLWDIIYVSIGGKSFPVIWAVIGGTVVAFLVGWLQLAWKKRSTPVPSNRR